MTEVTLREFSCSVINRAGSKTIGCAVLSLDDVAWGLLREPAAAPGRAVEVVRFAFGNTIVDRADSASLTPAFTVNAWLAPKRARGGGFGRIILSIDEAALRNVRSRTELIVRLVQAIDYLAGEANEVIHTYVTEEPNGLENEGS